MPMIGLGLGLALHKGGGVWYTPRALLSIDVANGRGRFGGVLYSSIAALLAAAGGVDASGVYTFGPYVAPGASENVSNGDGSSTTNWTATNGSVASVGGKLELTGSGSGSAALAQQVTVTSTRAYRQQQNVTRVSGGPGVYSAQAPGTSALAPSNYQTLVGSVGVETLTTAVWATEQATNWLGIRHNGASTGKSTLDDVSVKECNIFAGADGDKIAFRLRGNMPASITGTLCLFQAGDESERNRVRVDSQGGTLHLIVTYANTAQADITLGTKSALEAYDISCSVQDNLVFATLDGGDVQIDVASATPGMGKLWLGRSFTGESFGVSPPFVEIFDERMPVDCLWIEGDSYGREAADQTSLWASIQTQTNRRAFVTASGGSTLTNERDRVLAHPGFAADNTLVHWDGIPNGYGTNVADMAKYAAMVPAHGRYVFITPLVAPGSASDVNDAATALRTSLLAAYPTRCYDAQTFVDAQVTPFQGDNVHLTDTVMDLLAIDLAAWMAARGL